MGLVDIGVLGGTFDPIHNGHLTVAEDAAFKLGLQRVLFVPAADPWLKKETSVTGAGHRLAMVQLAVAHKPHLGVSTVDLERPGPSYTEDTLADLRRQLGRDVQLFFILGTDALAEFRRWRHPERIVEMCTLVAARRAGALAVDVASIGRSVPGISGRLILLDNPVVDISSTDIRRRVASGLSITGLVPAAVEVYITEHHLYRPTLGEEG